MEPALKVGDVVLVKPIATSQLHVGEIVVVHIPKAVQQNYHYPSSVVHRIVKISQTPAGLAIRTKGDNNAGEDPYTVSPSEVKGVVWKVIPYVGFPVLFFHSRQGLYFVISVVLLYALYRLMNYWEKREYSLKKSIISLLQGDVLAHLEILEKKQDQSVDRIEDALQALSHAVSEYALHLQSHTASVQSMAASAQALEDAARLQNEILTEVRNWASRTQDQDTSRRRAVRLRSSAQVKSSQEIAGIAQREAAATAQSDTLPDDQEAAEKAVEMTSTVTAHGPDGVHEPKMELSAKSDDDSLDDLIYGFLTHPTTDPIEEELTRLKSLRSKLQSWNEQI